MDPSTIISSTDTWSMYYSGTQDLVEIVRHANTKAGDLIPLDVKLYGLNPRIYMVSRLRYLKQRRKSAKYSVIVWRYGAQQPVKHITKTKLDKYIDQFNLVEE